MGLPSPEDALAGYSFSIEIDGVTIAQFKEVSGINAEIQTIEHRENKKGGLPIMKKLPGAKKYGDITLKHGKTDSKAVWEWLKTVQDGKGMVEETTKVLSRTDSYVSARHLKPSYNELIEAAKENHPDDRFLSVLPVLDVDEQHDITAPQMHVLFAQRRVALERHAGRLRDGLDAGRVLPDRRHGASMAAQRFGEGLERLALAVAAEDDHELRGRAVAGCLDLDRPAFEPVLVVDDDVRGVAGLRRPHLDLGVVAHARRRGDEREQAGAVRRRAGEEEQPVV